MSLLPSLLFAGGLLIVGLGVSLFHRRSVAQGRAWLHGKRLATLADRCIATLGGGASILVLLGVSGWALPDSGAPAVVASMGASAVLLFGVPRGPLSQPWPVIGGHGVSALIGVACARAIPHAPTAAGAAVGLAIGAMLVCRCLHPPGGATAFTAVMGGSAIEQLGFGFVLFPVLPNALVLVGLAVLLNGPFPARRYPARFGAAPPPPPPPPR